MLEGATLLYVVMYWKIIDYVLVAAVIAQLEVHNVNLVYVVQSYGQRKHSHSIVIVAVSYNNMHH
jgi:hypothetical protein